MYWITYLYSVNICRHVHVHVTGPNVTKAFDSVINNSLLLKTMEAGMQKCQKMKTYTLLRHFFISTANGQILNYLQLAGPNYLVIGYYCLRCNK